MCRLSPLFPYLLSVLPIIKSGVLKSPTIIIELSTVSFSIVEVSTVPFTSVIFCFIYFAVMLIGAWIFISVVSTYCI